MKSVTLQQRMRASMVVLAAVILSGCSLFSDDDGPVVKELQAFTPSVTPKVVWETSVGSGVGRYFSRLNPTVSGDLVIAGDRKGVIRAFNRADGKPVWQVDLRTQLNQRTGWLNFGGDDLRVSGGLTSNSKHVVIGTERGLLLALNVADGSIAWSATVGGEVLSDPAIGEGKVVVKTAGGDLLAFDENNGKQLWRVTTEVPALSIRGTSSPVIASGGALFGTATGKLTVVVLDNGLQAWEARLAMPKGATELQRIVDSDSKPLVLGNLAYSIAFNGQLSAVELNSGRVVWAREYSSFQNIALAGGRIFVSDNNDGVYGLELNGGIEQWANNDLTGRKITAPVAFAGHVVVGDEYGYLHFLNMANGTMSGRLEVDSDVYTAPVVVGDTMYVQTRDGSLLAVRM